MLKQKTMDTSMKNIECAQKERAIENNENGGFSCNCKDTNNLILGWILNTPSEFDKVDEIDLNRDIEDDRKGDTSGALRASSHLCGRQLQQPLMVHMVQTYKCPHGRNTCYIILHYGTDDQRQNDAVPRCRVCEDPMDIRDILPRRGIETRPSILWLTQ